MSTLLGICGSLRSGSFNRKLMLEAARHWDGPFEEGSLRLPLYDGDLEAEGIPAEVTRLSEQIAAAAAVVIVTPEYNKSISGVLKNGLDWVSRAEGNPWKDKPVAIMSATAGRSGGERAQWALRHALTPFQPTVLFGPEVLVGTASEQFDDDGRLTNEVNLKTVKDILARLRETADSAG